MKRGAKLFKRKKAKKDKREAGSNDEAGSSYGDDTEDDASNAGDYDTATDGEGSDTEDPTSWSQNLLDAPDNDGHDKIGGDKGRPSKELASQRAAKAPSPRGRPVQELDADGEEKRAPATDPLGLLGTLSLPPSLDQPARLDPTRDGFDPRKYLGDLHMQTSYADLQQGARALRASLRGQEIQLKTFVRDNFGRFISCKDSIDAIYGEIKDNDMSHHALLKLSDTFIETRNRADRMFGSLLDRRTEIEEKRNVLAALKRYQAVFNLPLTIQNHLHKEEYEKAVREYKKAVGYLAGTNVRIFTKVSDQIRSLADVLRDKLLASLRDPSLSLAQHEYHIGLLRDLGGEVDPAWHYLTGGQTTIVEALTSDGEAKERTNESASSLFTLGPLSHVGDAGSGGGGGGGVARLPTIRRLCNVLLTGLPSLIRMAHAHPPAPPQGVEGARKLVEECLLLFAQRVRAALATTSDAGAAAAGQGKPEGGTTSAGDRDLEDVRECILEVAACERGLAAVLSIIDMGTDSITPLVSELCLLFTSSIRQHTLARAARLGEDDADARHRVVGYSAEVPADDPEDDDDDDDEVGKGWGAHVYLSKRLAALLKSALRHYQSLPAIEERVIEEIESLAFEAVEAFADSLHSAAWPTNEEEDEEEDAEHKATPRHGILGLDPESRLIVAMASSAYAREEVVSLVTRLISTLRPVSSARASPKPSAAMAAVTEHLSTLESLLAAEYLRGRAAEVYASLGPALTDQFATPFSAPPEVRDYILEVVTGVVTAQAELSPVAFEARSLVISGVLERITSCYEESLRSCFPPSSRAQPWDWSCAPQLHTDILFLQTAFGKRLSPTASAALTRLQQSFLPRLSSSQEAEVRAAVDKGVARTGLVLRALQ